MQFRSPAMINGFLKPIADNLGYAENLLLLLQCAHFSQSSSCHAASCNIPSYWRNCSRIGSLYTHGKVTDWFSTSFQRLHSVASVMCHCQSWGFQPFPMSSPSIGAVPVTLSSDEPEGLVHCGFPAVGIHGSVCEGCQAMHMVVQAHFNHSFT